MTKASDNAFPSILITEGTEPSAPAAGKQRLYIDSTSHLLKATNSSGTDRTIEGLTNPMSTQGAIIYGGSGGTPTALTIGTANQVLRTNAGATAPEWATVSSSVGPYDIERRTAGDLTISSTSAGAAFPTIGNNIVAAASGDLLLIGLSCIWNSGGTSVGRCDAATMVSASPVNFVSSLSGTPATVGLPQWRAPVSTEVRLGASIVYVVQSGDISGGNVELRLCGWVDVATSKTVQANTNSPLVFWVKNLKQ